MGPKSLWLSVDHNAKFHSTNALRTPSVGVRRDKTLVFNSIEFRHVDIEKELLR